MSDRENSEYIGTAWLEEDGTIMMRLRATTGEESKVQAVGVGTLRYPRSHPQYASILNHLGEIFPGEQVLVRPWPD